MARNVRNQFPEFDNIEVFNTVLDEISPHDSSWKNDAMPSILVCVDKRLNLEIIIWIDYENENLREWQGEKTITVIATTEDEPDGIELWTGEPHGEYIEEIKSAILKKRNMTT